ncbi:hypothetical protein IFM89_031354 [Coptis chinensis]|uniref:HNH domain-containing protein n=1 Tax=Coptis chinensis TaxID=261450 RepID=A0A835ME03_9MAGN|nr:hypothetical protein IFM89_031354 [Coptis chinensis]
MKPRTKKDKRRTSSFSSSSSPARNSSVVPRATSLHDHELITEPTFDFEGVQITPELNNNYFNANPRSFPYSVKQQCWEKADKIKGRDPERWRRDYLGNLVFRKLTGCAGCLCHDYDHIVPFSKGGKSTLENCQVLQATANKSKGNRMEMSKADLIQKSSYCRVSGRDMDLLELSAYGNVRRGQDSGGCRIQ